MSGIDTAVDAAAPRDLEERAARREGREGVALAAPGFVYLLVFFAFPLAVVVMISFATRGSFGQTLLTDWNLRSYGRLFDPLVATIVWRSFILAVAATVVSLGVGYPFAYYIATRRPAVRYALLLLVMIPFWTNFLVRTYAWRVILGGSGPLAQLTEALGFEPVRLLFTNSAVLIGLVYGFLPFMVLPLYASIERMDWDLVEAARDLYAPGWAAFRKVTLPLTRPGILAGSILVFIPSFGAFVTPELLGGARTTMLGSYIFGQFLSSRDWPFGAALSTVVLLVMLGATMVYFRKGGRTL